VDVFEHMFDTVPAGATSTPVPAGRAPGVDRRWREATT
jgi:hypothetical protein